MKATVKVINPGRGMYAAEINGGQKNKTASAPSEAGARLRVKVSYAVRSSDPLRPRVMGSYL